MKALLIFFIFIQVTFASSIDRISYQGRLLQATGTPIAGPVDLTFKVYLNAVATAECSQTINAVSLSQGIFNVELTFPTDCTGGSKTITQFMIDAANNGDSVYIEITDDTHSKTYGKQMFTANTFAMVAKGVTNQSISNTSLLGMSANCANGEIIQTDGLGNFYCGSVNGSLGSGIDAVLIGDGSVNNTEYQYLDGVTSNIQTQLNAKQAADADLTDLADGSLTGSKVGSGISATNVTTGSLNAVRVGGGAVDNTEFGYLNGVTSAIQTQLNAKQAADVDLTDLADGSLTGSKVGSGISATNVTTGSLNAVRVGGGAVDNTEFGYLNGVTSSVQTQLNAKLAKSGGTMSGNIAMGGSKVTGLGAPVAIADAATKDYVDAAVAGGTICIKTWPSCAAGWTDNGDVVSEGGHGGNGSLLTCVTVRKASYSTSGACNLGAFVMHYNNAGCTSWRDVICDGSSGKYSDNYDACVCSPGGISMMNTVRLCCKTF